MRVGRKERECTSLLYEAWTTVKLQRAKRQGTEDLTFGKKMLVEDIVLVFS